MLILHNHHEKIAYAPLEYGYKVSKYHEKTI
jgi:hypothetical protein